VNHIVNSCGCPLNKLDDDGLLQIHSAENNAVIWLKDEIRQLYWTNCVSHYLPVISNRLHCVSKNWTLCLVSTENKLLSM